MGLARAGVTIAHLCDVTDDEIARLAAAGITATHAPGCDVPMGWGIAPVRRLQEAGITVGLGTSGGGSNDAGHLLADAPGDAGVGPGRHRPAGPRCSPWPPRVARAASVAPTSAS
jgi:hypothetical protein